eukprot:626546-Amphidinium_carterae.1
MHFVNSNGIFASFTDRIPDLASTNRMLYQTLFGLSQRLAKGALQIGNPITPNHGSRTSVLAVIVVYVCTTEYDWYAARNPGTQERVSKKRVGAEMAEETFRQELD